MRAIREIVLDTETTGLTKNDKLIEVAGVELVNRVKTGRVFHHYLNPEMEVSAGAIKVHGLTNDFLNDKPLFRSVADTFLDFIADSLLIIHNAEFDLGFLNKELSVLGLRTILYSQVLDTLKLARKKYPGSPASLDALCKRFKISLSERDKHGALLDAHLLTHVYIALTGNQQSSLSLVNDNGSYQSVLPNNKPNRPSRNFVVTAQELEEHKNFLAKIKNPLWNNG